MRQTFLCGRVTSINLRILHRKIAVVAIDTPCHARSGYLYLKWLCVVTPADSGHLAASMLAPYRPQPKSRNLFFALDISA